MRTLGLYAALALTILKEERALDQEPAIIGIVNNAHKINAPKPPQKFVRWKGARKKHGRGRP